MIVIERLPSHQNLSIVCLSKLIFFSWAYFSMVAFVDEQK
jgi:hypothetical protein